MRRPAEAWLAMAYIDITDGPSKGELVTRVMSSLPVTFVTAGGEIEVLIEQIEEHASGNHYAFVGRIVAGPDAGSRGHGLYDCQGKIRTITASSNGPNLG
jgi:hypothetical protein